MKNKKQKMEIRFADDDWTNSFDELKEKEAGLRKRLLEAYRQTNMLKQGEKSGNPDKSMILEHTRTAIEKYQKALEEVEELIKQRKTGTA